MQFVAKVELFEKRWQGWVLSRLGAFPIRRGQSDETAMETARLIVERGGTVIIFPEGTRHPHAARSGRPKRGVGRLALETGAAVLPVAVQGSEEVRRGWRIRPRKVRLRAGKPITFPRTERPSPALAATVTDRIWPNIELQWEWLGGLPPLRKAAVIGAGSWGTAVAVLLARGGLEVELGTRTEEKAELIDRKRENEEYLPGVKLPEGLVGQARERDRARRLRPDLPRRAPRPRCRTSSARSATGSARAPRCCCSPRASSSRWARCRTSTSPSASAPARSPASAARRTRARRPPEWPPSCSAAADPDLRAMLGEVFDRAGLVCERTDDVTGVEVAGRGQERRRARRRGGRALRAQRRRDRRRRRLARVRRVRARQGRPPGDLLRASPASAT